MTGNDIGKSPNNFAKLVPNMITFLNHFGRLHTFKLGHNNMRGGQGVVDKLLLGFGDMATLTHLDLQHNLLGQKYGS